MKYVYILSFICGLNVLPLWGQIAPSSAENIDYLITFGKEAEKSWGDDDYSQVHFFVIPKNETKPVYINVFDPDISGAHDTPNNTFNTKCSFKIYGGKGTHSTKAARSVNPVKGYDSGRLMASKTFGADKQYDGKWYSFGPFNPNEGEYSEQFGGNIFKIICSGLSGDDGNAYKYALSYEKEDNIPIENGNIFTYELCFRFKEAANSVTHIYPFLEENILSFKQFNFDADHDLYIRVTTIARKLVAAKTSGNGLWSSSEYRVLEREKKSTADIQMTKKSNGVNDMVVHVLNQYNQAVPMFSVPIGGKPKYHYNLKVNFKY